MKDIQDYINDGSKLVRLTAEKRDLVFLQGTLNTVLKVTPASVHKPKGPSSKTPRANIPFNINKDSIVLDSHRAKMTYSEAETMYLYESGLKFPPPLSGEKGHRIIEFVISVPGIYLRNISFEKKKGETNNEYQERCRKYEEAFGYHRYWFAIPKSIPDDAISIIGGKDNKCFLVLTDREYARRVIELNQLKGAGWESVEHLKSNKNTIFLLIILIIVSMTIGWIIIWDNVTFWRFVLWIGLIPMGISGLITNIYQKRNKPKIDEEP